MVQGFKTSNLLIFPYGQMDLRSYLKVKDSKGSMLRVQCLRRFMLRVSSFAFHACGFEAARFMPAAFQASRFKLCVSCLRV